MARNGTWLLAALAFLTAATDADEALVQRWDKPRVESFAMRGALPENVIEEIRRRYGIPIEGVITGLPRMDFEAEGLTFFEALDRFASAHRLLVAGRSVAGEQISLVRPMRPLPAAPVAHVGPSRLSVQTISVLAAARWTTGEPRKRSIKDEIARILSDRRRADRPHLRVEFQWITEPGFEEVALVGWSAQRVVDDTGTEIAVRAAPDLPLAANGCFSVEFEKPSRNARFVATLEGRLRVALPFRESQVEFNADEIKRWKSFGDARVKLEDIDPADTVVRLSIEGVPCGPLKACMGDLDVNVHDVRVGPNTGGSFLTVAVLAYRADGTEIAGSLRRTWWDVNFPSITYWIGLDDAPARLVLRTTTAALVREAPFSFADIPLPE